MRIKETKLYPFDELSDAAKDKAVELLYDLNMGFEWWESVYEDAERAGIRITAFDCDRGSIEGDFTQTPHDVAQSIIKEHGEDCETRKTAEKYLDSLIEPQDPDPDSYDDADEGDMADFAEACRLHEEWENSCHEFLHDILEDYLITLRKEYEYLASKEAIIESILANEYEFTEEGKLA